MERLEEVLKENLENDKFIYAVLSDKKTKGLEYKKVTIKPVKIKDNILIQFTFNYDKKVIHNNLSIKDAIGEILDLIKDKFKQMMIFTVNNDYQVFSNKKSKIRILKKSPTKAQVNINHNKKKNYIIQEGDTCDFLIQLGVMNEEGKVYKKKYNKFRQINRFLEMVSDVIPNLNKNKKLKIIDFGCGKSYLTFALYYYLVDKLDYNVEMIGLDLKEDVIDFCNELSRTLNYEDLRFEKGDIEGFNQFDNVDMVITLHACDTATDDALVKAVHWGANVIMSVPCCQHELFNKIDNEVMVPMLKHGIIKEKLSSLITDSIRGNILEILGYDIQLLEFIDMEHTPKNILIRGIKKGVIDSNKIDEYLEFKKFWKVDPYIEKKMGSVLEKRLKGGY
ncbi:SAM-dependent methyltransferase [Clostridium sp. D2Q-11]|uniref:SAM-dependent methyltransferase n=1 Tax=Anaeromonas frigoriresistens TaxID=2683708 RepID=A0A942UYV9_9FIRM|nr:SAM-dependent methyltransferase [Anaeromonas frigoriresistens]MBS4539531.1 SAM-dependent methyltransferase [Anaeromonas frigoriresistens]